VEDDGGGNQHGDDNASSFVNKIEEQSMRVI